MTAHAVLQIAFFLTILFILVKPLGLYMANVFEQRPCGIDFILGPVERFIYRFGGVKADQEMDWQRYSIALLLFNFFGFLFVYALQHWQNLLPFNPANLGSVSASLAFNTAISYITNTNWQAYSGETTLSYLSQFLGLTVQNFVSAATGIAVLLVLIRGLIRRETNLLGNFWVDLTRSTLYILLPLSFILALALVSQGVVQNFHPYQQSVSLEQLSTTTRADNSKTVPTIKSDSIAANNPNLIPAAISSLPMGPAASQIAIKQLGTNGGGFFGVNSAHPFENPTPLSNFLELLAIILIPASLCFSFGKMISNFRQGFAIFIAMTAIFVPLLFGTISAELQTQPQLESLPIEQKPIATIIDNYHHSLSAGGNMEGKETRFGPVDSAIFATTTTAVANGAVNASLDSFTPLGGMIPMWLMQLGEVIYGGSGSGLYGMLLFVILTVFIAGLMVGRTPEFLGKKIEVFEMKMACLAILVPHVLILFGCALAIVTKGALAAIGNPGSHGFSEMLYAFTSTANNNGSAFAGLNANTTFYNITTAIAMLFGRFLILLPVMAIAASLAKKKTVPSSPGTMPTSTPLFVSLLVSVVLIVGALTFFPALALGPIVEHLLMH